MNYPMIKTQNIVISTATTLVASGEIPFSFLSL